MTPAQIELLTGLAVLIGGLIGLPLAILQIIDTSLEIADKLSKRQKKRGRRRPTRRGRRRGRAGRPGDY